MASIYQNIKPLDLSNVQTYPLASRQSKVAVDDFAHPLNDANEATLKSFLDSLPNILAVQSLRQVAIKIRDAKARNRACIFGIGGHVVKVGLAPVIIDLMRRGYVSSIAANGSVLVHDAEIALIGSTSEDVDATLGAGAFGAAEETALVLNQAAKEGAKDNIGLGEALGRLLINAQPQYKDLSLLCACYGMKIPFTAHVAIGTDIPHFHPSTDGAALGATTHIDFRLFAEMVRRMNDGGCYLNFGSAVILPEVFLKAVTLIRNLGFPLKDFTTANFDFIQSYRPTTNVIRRPVADNQGQSFALTGHHEIMLPLLAAQIING